MTTHRLNSKLVRHEHNGGVTIYHWCEGCGHAHGYQVPRWSYDGNADAPTFLPSMRVFVTLRDGTQKTLCHYFLKAGQIEYLADCDHPLAGRTIPLPDMPVNYYFSDVPFGELPQI